jgi:MerR family transcriptional regulator/heat shock protein HspR
MSDPSPTTQAPPRIAADDEPSHEPRYAVTAVAVRVGLRVETVRRYEAFGLIESARDETGLARYSDADIDRIRRARRLIDDLGVNLAGAAAILHLRQQLLALQRELRALRETRPGS